MVRYPIRERRVGMMVTRMRLVMLGTLLLLNLHVVCAGDVVLRIPDDDPNENSDIVRSVAFSPDGEVVAAGYGRFVGLLQNPRPGQVILWDSRTAKPLARLLGYRDGVSSVAFSPDGKLLATAGFAGDLKLWNPQTRKLYRDLSIGEACGVVLTVAFSPDGTRLAAGLWTGESQGQAWIWDVASGRIVVRLRGHTDGVQAVAFSPGGRLLATGSMDGTARLWDTATNHAPTVLTCEEIVKIAEARFRAVVPDSRRREYKPQPWVNSVAFSPDRTSFVAAFGESVPGCHTGIGTIKLWDVATLKPGATLGNQAEFVRIAYSPDGELLASAMQDNSVKIWDAASLKERGSLTGGWPFAFSPDRKRLVMTTDDAILTVTALPANIARPATS